MSNIEEVFKALPIKNGYERTFTVVDCHTAGEPARVILNGLPCIPGETMAEKKAYLLKHHDHYRTALMHEPRGHNDMFGSFILPTNAKEADYGVVFIDGGGYLNMCGHNTIAAVKVALETGLISRKEKGLTEVVVQDTPAGLIKAVATYDECGTRIKEVTFDNVASFLYKENQVVQLEGIGDITFDVAFGGSFFALIHASELGIKVTPDYASQLISIGMKIRRAINEQIEIKHPTMPHINTVDLVEIYDEPTHPLASYKNVVVFGEGQLDRSPCGTGTSAKMATLFARGELKVGDTFVYESIIGTLFTGVVKEETNVGTCIAIVPNISGSAYITGYSTFVLDPKDPVKYGFKLK